MRNRPWRAPNAVPGVGHFKRAEVGTFSRAPRINSIHVEFDGEGDSGQINGVSALAGDQPAELPATKITIQQIRWGQTKAALSEFTLETAIEALCYDYLEQKHDGWENNEGGYGDFHIDVDKRTIELVFNGRFTETFTENHTF